MGRQSKRRRPPDAHPPSGCWPRSKTSASDALPAPTSVHRWLRSKTTPTYYQSSCTPRPWHIGTSLTTTSPRQRWPYGSAASRSDPEGNSHHKFEKDTRPGPSTATAKGRDYTERGPVSPGERRVRRRDPGSKPTTGTPAWMPFWVHSKGEPLHPPLRDAKDQNTKTAGLCTALTYVEMTSPHACFALHCHDRNNGHGQATAQTRRNRLEHWYRKLWREARPNPPGIRRGKHGVNSYSTASRGQKAPLPPSCELR